jgi:ubiquinone/menaquinone biosynthesis C-methylase UbiE
MTTKQRDIFLASEADEWYRRNRGARSAIQPHPTSWVHRVPELVDSLDQLSSPRLLEIGASDGVQLRTVSTMCEVDCFGVEPSQLAVDAAKMHGTKVARGTAESLPFETDSFDIVVFGFCLYVCDPRDYEAISREADRVLRTPGYVVIQDFYSPEAKAVPYAHVSGMTTTKMDFRELFADYPAYLCLDHSIRGHETGSYTDDANEWVMTSVLRKRCLSK